MTMANRHMQGGLSVLVLLIRRKPLAQKPFYDGDMSPACRPMQKRRIIAIPQRHILGP